MCLPRLISWGAGWTIMLYNFFLKLSIWLINLFQEWETAQTVQILSCKLSRVFILKLFDKCVLQINWLLNDILFWYFRYMFYMYRALHLRFEKGMVGLSFCDFVATRLEKVLMAMYRMKEWPRRFKVTLVQFFLAVETKVNKYTICFDSKVICRMVHIYGRWLFRSGRRDDALLNLVKLQWCFGQWATPKKLTYMLLLGRSMVDRTAWHHSGICSLIL